MEPLVLEFGDGTSRVVETEDAARRMLRALMIARRDLPAGFTATHAALIEELEARVGEVVIPEPDDPALLLAYQLVDDRALGRDVPSPG